VLGCALGLGLGALLGCVLLGQAALEQFGALMVLIPALLWGAEGAIRGARQAPAWPNTYAIRRWLVSLLAWGSVSVIVVCALLQLMAALYPEVSWIETALQSRRQVLSTVLILSVIPATAAESRAARAAQRAPRMAGHGPLLRRLARAGAALALLVVVLWGYRAVQPWMYALWRSEAVVAVRQTGIRAHSALRSVVDGCVDSLYVRYLEAQRPGRVTIIDGIVRWFSEGIVR